MVKPKLGAEDLPSQWHVTVKPSDTRGKRVIIIGDIHGHREDLEELLKACKFDPDKDVVVQTGDLVNKGPANAQVLQFAKEKRFYCVRGNHDELALQAYRSLQNHEQLEKPEVVEWVKDLSAELAGWLRGLPYTLRLPDYNIIVVHAGLVPGVALEEQKERDMVTMRDVVTEGDAPCSGKKKPWSPVWDGELGHIIFGHDAKRGLQVHKKPPKRFATYYKGHGVRPVHATGIDTRCVYGCYLTACILPPIDEDTRKPGKMEKPAKDAWKVKLDITPSSAKEKVKIIGYLLSVKSSYYWDKDRKEVRRVLKTKRHEHDVDSEDGERRVKKHKQKA